MNNNQTIKSILPHGFIISLGYLASIFSLLLILILILMTLFLLFIKQKDKCIFDDNESLDGMSRTASERRSFKFQRSKQYSSIINDQLNSSIGDDSFRMNIDDQNTRSTINLLSTK